jgi:O-antigen/teichoic acid export membrane protein
LKNVHTANRIFKNTLALSIASAGQLVGNIILFFYLSRLLQAEGLGIYATVMAVFQTATLGCGIGLNTFLTRELPRNLAQTNRYLIQSGLISLASALLLIAGLYLLIPHLGYLPQTQMGLYIIALALIPESLNIVLYATFISHQKAEFITATSVVVILGRISVSLLALYLGFGVISLIVVYAAFSYLSLLMYLFFLRRHILAPQWEFSRQFLWRMLRDLKVFAALAVLNGLFSQSEVLILSLMGGETQVGYYSAALKLVSIWAMLPTAYMTATFPVLSATFQESRPAAVDIQNRSLKYLMALAFPLAVGMTVTAGVIIPLIYGPGFQESIEVLRILAWYLPLIFCNMVLWRVLIVRGEQRTVFQVQFVTEILQVLLAVWLIPALGCNGAAWAVLGGNLAYALLSIYYVRRDNTPLPLVQLCWRFVLASFVMGLFTWLCVPWLSLLILVPAAAIVYLALVWMLHAFSSDDIALFRQALSFSKKAPLARQEIALTDANK